MSFNWDYAKTTDKIQFKRDLSVFVAPKSLRYGTLFRCEECNQLWYLYGNPQFMNFVPAERIPLIEKWDKHEITLSNEHAISLKNIGRTPPDIYGNGMQYHEFPCAVTTIDGEHLDMAVISLQQHAPFESWRNSRLATEIAQIRPSIYALPLVVRVATANAEEIGMGLSPTVIEMTDGSRITLNGRHNFFAKDDCDSSKIFVSKKQFHRNNPPPFYERPEGIVYFIADEPRVSESMGWKEKLRKIVNSRTTD